jgi:hypothetical protein
MVKATQNKFPYFNACSFDKGFHSIANQQALKKELEQVVLPKKGLSSFFLATTVSINKNSYT